MVGDTADGTTDGGGGARRASGTVIVGAQWGDEGKGKIVDHFAAEADVVVRFQGGANAGHSLVVAGEKTVLHLIPSGALRPGVICAIGPGCVVDPLDLVSELDMLAARGVAISPERLRVCRRAHLVLPVHRALDVAREHAAGADRIGTTGRGIGPAYEDAVARRGVRVWDLLDPARLRARVEGLLPERNAVLAHLGAPTVTVEETLAAVEPTVARVRPFVREVGTWLSARLAAGDRVLFEGAQGSLLDVLHGTYPYVTSSFTLAGGATVGAGVGPAALTRVVGVAKAYATRVGAGPFPTEDAGGLGERLRRVGQEFGATTGRPRRCGALDVPALREAARLSGMTELVITKLDVLSGLGEIPVAVDYHLDGTPLADFPVDPGEMERVLPVYTSLPGWSENLSSVRAWTALPAAARNYVEWIERAVGVPVRWVSVGPDREATLAR